MGKTLFISDLHLSPERRQIMDLFIDFTKEIATKADKLYILGDFLEAWLGDDDPAEEYADVFDAIKELVDKHQTKVYLMHGNRDFLVGEELAERCHFKLIDDPTTITIANKKTMLIHGDTLCTDDIEYQKFRAMVRNPEWQKMILSKSLEERYALARQMREQSKHQTASKAEDIMDVNDKETEKLFLDNDLDLLIHGHTHRPAFHHLSINDKPLERIVLGDWYDKGSYLSVDENNSITMNDFPSIR